MTWHPFVLIACLASPAFGETVKITSGEHDGFTRLVLDYGHPVDWQVGRSADGYQLRLVGEAATYDVTAAFNLIGKSRLAAIWAAPDTGDLSIGLACACHAIPFEFRPGTVVIDLKDGPPPKGSSFESAFEGGPLAPLTSVAPVRPRARPDNLPPAPKGGGDGYDWTKATQDTATDEAPIGDALNLRDPELQPLRTAILQEMAQGATQGVVNMAVPNGQDLGLISAGFPAAQIRIGPASTSVNQPDGSLHGDLGAQGRTCIAPKSSTLRLGATKVWRWPTKWPVCATA